MNIEDSLVAFLDFARKVGRVRAVQTVIGAGGEQPLAGRQKMAVFVAHVLGHDIPNDAFVEQHDGAVGVCTRCLMIVKVPREAKRGEPAALGGALEHECPNEDDNSSWNKAAREGRTPS